MKLARCWQHIIVDSAVSAEHGSDDACMHACAACKCCLQHLTNRPNSRAHERESGETLVYTVLQL